MYFDGAACRFSRIHKSTRVYIVLNYGLLKKDKKNKPIISIPVISRYIGMEAARKAGRKSILMVVEESSKRIMAKAED